METFLEEVNKKVHGVPLQACYHCRKCTAGCPMTKHMEYNPNKVIKMIQNGQRDKVLNSSTIWICLSCETCITRCPNKVDIARMMDVLRQVRASCMWMLERASAAQAAEEPTPDPVDLPEPAKGAEDVVGDMF